MKYYILAGIVVIAGIVAVLVAQQQAEETAAVDAQREWKRVAIEMETKVRPDRYEQMKWKPDLGVELRAPASKTK